MSTIQATVSFRGNGGVREMRAVCLHVLLTRAPAPAGATQDTKATGCASGETGGWETGTGERPRKCTPCSETVHRHQKE